MIDWKKIGEVDRSRFFVNTASKNIFLEKFRQNIREKKIHPFIFNYLYIGSIYYMFSDKIFFRSIKQSSSVHLDGFFLGKVIRSLYKIPYEDFTPQEYLPDIFDYSEKNKIRLFLLGSYPRNKGIQQALNNIQIKYPRLLIKGIDGYSSDQQVVLDKIHQFKTEVLIVGLGLHSQELWIHKYQNDLNVKVIISTGNYIDILAGRIKAPHNIYKKLHIRWLRRLLKDPKRLWRRYFGGLFFLVLIIMSNIRKRVL